MSSPTPGQDFSRQVENGERATSCCESPSASQNRASGALYACELRKPQASGPCDQVHAPASSNCEAGRAPEGDRALRRALPAECAGDFPPRFGDQEALARNPTYVRNNKNQLRKLTIAIVDSGSGNLRSLRYGLRQCGAEPAVLREPPPQAPAVLFLPGVGAFGHASAALHERGWYEAIPAFLAQGSRLVGICLGMQLLFESSEESPGALGLGLIAGVVRRLNPGSAKVPHIGWARLKSVGARAAAPEWAYFVHSYVAKPENDACVDAWAVHGEDPFPAAVRSGPVMGVQFHPEKSQGPGIAYLAVLAGDAS